MSLDNFEGFLYEYLHIIYFLYPITYVFNSNNNINNINNIFYSSNSQLLMVRAANNLTALLRSSNTRLNPRITCNFIGNRREYGSSPCAILIRHRNASPRALALADPYSRLAPPP